jgi:hypothetical protein
MLASVAVWIWRLANTALLAAVAWILWHQAEQLAALNGTLTSLLDYLSVIAERIG